MKREITGNHDRRIARSKRAIRDAFVKLLSERPVEKITITAIAEYANVDRKTVYNYYLDKNEIVDEIEDEIISQFSSELGSFSFCNENDCQLLIDKFSRAILDNSDVFGDFLKIGADVRLMRKLNECMRAKLEAELKANGMDEKKAKRLAVFITGGIIGAYRSWYRESPRSPLDETAREIGHIVFSGMNSLMGK